MGSPTAAEAQRGRMKKVEEVDSISWTLPGERTSPLRKTLQSLQSDRLGRPDLEPRLQEAREKVAKYREGLRSFDYKIYTEKTHADGDQTGRLLARLANPAQRRSLIVKLNRSSGEPLETQEEINACFASFYWSLYHSRLPMTLPNKLDSRIVAVPRLGPAEADTLREETTLPEVLGVLKRMACGKVPGSDGLLIKCYSTYSAEMAPRLVKLFYEVRTLGYLPSTRREAVIILLLKPGKLATEVGAYRPLSMWNVDCKILSGIYDYFDTS
ncbi:hypothetical protein NDU88_002519 [Pleurodeles waltl]|uniref:Uncharacterized protein n=1 Tax=Pleurodeles waltl TaxID=8319 RepID=A0AAV7UXY5_PLEWA|nr:hypothetical protein NDU88_002519 [Pleurodeles waltl]